MGIYRYNLLGNSFIQISVMHVMKFQVYIYQDEDGRFVAECPIIPGCVSGGDTYAEAIEMIKDAIEGCLEVRK